MDSSTQKYVVLHHVLSAGQHWDLMLQTGAKLATWQLAAPPPPPPGGSIAARRIGEHRMDYLEYEGPVSGDRGNVSRVDRGSLRLLARSADDWVFELAGRLCRGVYRLVRSPSQSEDLWLFQLHSGETADRGNA